MPEGNTSLPVSRVHTRVHYRECQSRLIVAPLAAWHGPYTLLSRQRLPLPIRHSTYNRGPVQQETAYYTSQGHHPPGNLLLLLSELKWVPYSWHCCHATLSAMTVKIQKRAGRLASTSNAWIAKIQCAAAARLWLSFAHLKNHFAMFLTSCIFLIVTGIMSVCCAVRYTIQ